VFDILKRLLVGRPIRSERMGETLLPKWLALPVFASDPLSSVAYATEQILLTLALGGAGFLAFSAPVAGGVVFVLVVVVASYRQTCHAYPNGGGAFVVSKENLGESAALTAASALLVDYVMTVAVSVVAGVVAITSAIRPWAPHGVAISVGFVVLLALANLRGVKESSKAFAIPTYTFVGLTYLMFVAAGLRATLGAGVPPAESAAQPLPPSVPASGIAVFALVLRAFAAAPVGAGTPQLLISQAVAAAGSSGGVVCEVRGDHVARCRCPCSSASRCSRSSCTRTPNRTAPLR